MLCGRMAISMKNIDNPRIPGQQHFRLGLFVAAHLGDTLCTSTLPRQVHEEYGKKVVVTDHECTRTIFANNMHVQEFISLGFMRPKLKCVGHLIQRLQLYFDVCISKLPKPDLFISEQERSWVESEKERWPRGLPTCLLSPQSFTDRRHFADVDWDSIRESLLKRSTVVQPILTTHDVYREQLKNRISSHTIDNPDGLVLYQDLSLRQYIALFSVVDAFCGVTSGGAHVAAAFDVPAMILVWDDLANQIQFPSTKPGFHTCNFLYPQHNFLAVGNVTRDRVERQALDEIIDKTLAGQIEQKRLVELDRPRKRKSKAKKRIASHIGAG